jgi:alcohol dehydrogenase class IV
MTDFEKARALLREFKGNSYLFGTDVLPKIGRAVAAKGKNVALVRGSFSDSDDYVRIIRESLADSGVNLVAEIKGVRPNCPREDMFRIADSLRETETDVVISFGGGSTIDAVKAAEVLRTLDGDINAYFGMGLVTKALHDRGKSLSTHVAIQTVASSAANCTSFFGLRLRGNVQYTPGPDRRRSARWHLTFAGGSLRSCRQTLLRKNRRSGQHWYSFGG